MNRKLIQAMSTLTIRGNYICLKGYKKYYKSQTNKGTKEKLQIRKLKSKDLRNAHLHIK